MDDFVKIQCTQQENEEIYSKASLRIRSFMFLGLLSDILNVCL